MDLLQKIRTLPSEPGVYLYKNAEGEVVYVGKAKNLRARVRSYFVEGVGEANAKTGSLLREAVDLEYIVVANNKEALALENNLIKQKKPRFNILLRDDKTFPYIKLTLAERFPRVYVTRRLRKDGSVYFGPYFPGNLAYRIVDLIHRHFLVPSCKVDLTRYHPRPCLQYYIKRCLGPCVQDLTTPEAYAEAVRDVQLLLEGRQTDLAKSLRGRMAQAAEAEEYERAARYRDLLSTLDQLQEKQRMAAVEGDDSDVFGYHFENDMLAVNIFHLRGGKIVDRREFFWEELPESFDPGEFFSALLKQIYIDQQYVPRSILAPVDFEDREALGELLSDRRGRKVEIIVAQRGEKRSLIDLAAQNAKQSFDQRFRVMKPTGKATQEALQDALGLPELPRRIECFDISHIQGAETVASMVVWEDGKMNKSAYRKFIVRTVSGVDDFAAMHEVVTRRYRRLRDEGSEAGSSGGKAQGFPGLVLVDGGLGQLHAATAALDDLEITNQPVAAIAKKEEVIYVAGQESEPVVLDRHSPVLHLVQMIRDESHRFAVTFHRKRRQMRDRASELLEVPGIGERTRQRLLQHFGSVRAVQEADAAALSAVLTRAQTEAVLKHFSKSPTP
ncbi:MAG TPA: excinuclease ABC subunit UvrC [Candidatus Angelobacter sp.]|nr:excinuclease ABC subunit UvrC [Candidatus Angelobacter sp.]